MKREARELVIMQRRMRQDVEKHGGKAECGCSPGRFRKVRPLGCHKGAGCMCRLREETVATQRADADMKQELVFSELGEMFCTEHPEEFFVWSNRHPDCPGCVAVHASFPPIVPGVRSSDKLRKSQRRDLVRQIRDMKRRLAVYERRLARLDAEPQLPFEKRK